MTTSTSRVLVVVAVIALAVPTFWWWSRETLRRTAAADVAPMVVGDLVRLRRDGPRTLYAALRQADVSGLAADLERNTDVRGRTLVVTGRGFAVDAGALAEVQQVTDDAALLLFVEVLQETDAVALLGADGPQGWVPRTAIAP